MKAKLKCTLILLFLFGLKSFAQTYALDPSFGNSGVKQNPYSDIFTPKNGLLINNYYYLFSNYQLLKMDYNGNVVYSFANNGLLQFYVINKTYEIENIKFINGYFYLYGNLRDLVTDTRNFFICKVDENGNFDSNFGTNGMVQTIDFGFNEYLRDFIIDASGNLFCIGTQNEGYDGGYFPRMINFKLNPNGTLNTAYDVNGFKRYTTAAVSPIPSTQGKYIGSYNGKYLMVGTYAPTSQNSKLFLVVIDNNGTIDFTYDANGFKQADLEYGGLTLNQVKRINESLYISYFWATSFASQGGKLMHYDLSTNQTIFNGYSMYYSYIQVENNGLYLTGFQRCTSTCYRDFELRRYLPNGTIDTSFNNTGLFTYNSEGPPPSFPTDDVSRYIIKDANDKILIGGLNYSIRIADVATLSSNELNLNTEVLLFPNPFVDKINLSLVEEVNSIEIFDLLGRKIDVPKIENEGQNYVIDASKIKEKGAYLIKMILKNNKVISKKIIRQ